MAIKVWMVQAVCHHAGLLLTKVKQGGNENYSNVEGRMMAELQVLHFLIGSPIFYTKCANVQTHIQY